ncbi:MAG: IS3 family transposase, partial [Fusobacteria bacterium]|nr:IS3 family transposase [Fusobacteriota bacterium]
ESFHSILKNELVYHEKYKTRQQAIDSITEYILHFYNSNRIHGAINDCTPIQFEKIFYVSKSKKVS